MHISYVTTYDALNIRNWSGLGYHIAKALELQGAAINYVGDLHYPFEPLFKAKQVLYQLAGKRYLRDREPFVVKSYAQQAMNRIDENADIIFCPGTLPVAYINNRKPKVIYTDATFAGMINYYETFSNLCAETVRKGHAIEQMALDSCQLAIFSSDWAAQTAMSAYNISAEKVKVVPFGANIQVQHTVDDIVHFNRQKSTDTCMLLFLAVEWERKGGDVVMKAAELLNKMGQKTELHIVGLTRLPGLPEPPDFVKLHGFVSKATDEGQKILENIMQQSHFLFLPSRADCTPIVFSEAAAFGLPIISTKTGGIPTVVKEGVNGVTMDINSTPQEYAQWIYDIFTDQSRYKNLSRRAFGDYMERLNWDVSGKKIMELINNI